MTYAEIVRKYSEKATKNQMEHLTDITNDFIEKPYDKALFFDKIENVFCKFLTEKQAKDLVSKMINEDGTKGEKWSMEIIKQVWTHPEESDKYNFAEVYYTMNMVYSDYFTMYKEQTELYIEHTYLFLTDKDFQKEGISKAKWYATYR